MEKSHVVPLFSHEIGDPRGVYLGLLGLEGSMPGLKITRDGKYMRENVLLSRKVSHKTTVSRVRNQYKEGE